MLYKNNKKEFSDELFKNPEVLQDRMNADPANHRHEKLEKGIDAGNQAHASERHFGFVESVGHGYREGIHRQAHT